MTSRRRLYLERRRAARAAIEATQPVTELCAAIRSFFYGKQRAFFCGPAKRKATRKTRRAGATAGGCREFIARAVEYPKWRGTYVTTTRIEAKARAWESDTQSGLVDVIRAYGTALDTPGVPTYSLGGVTVEVREQELALVFSNGSRIELFGADDEHSLRKERGKAKHVIWIDEAQDFRWLTKFYKAVVVGCLTDFKGECWLSGTPGVDCVGMFYDITDEAGAGMKGWEVHAIAVVDNPFFGCVVWREGKWYVVDNEKAEAGPFADEAAAEAEAVRVRWAQTAQAALEENGWTEEDPDFQREWLARWVKTDARFVYAANAVADHDLCYAPVRLQEDGFPDLVAALADLPGRSATDARPREYVLVLGADLGTRDAFAFVVWAYSQLDPNLYELASWKRTGLDYDEMAGFLHAVQRQAYCGIVVADAGGGGKPAVMGWSKAWVDQYKLPITEAEKSNKPVAIKQLNNDIRHRRMRMRFGSPLLVEWRSHRWAPKRTETGSMVEDTTENHCFVAGTLVRTATGEVPIESVRDNDMVWTRQGLRRVVISTPTRVMPTFTATFEDGRTLTGTGDHQIWTEAGWKRLESLTQDDTVTVWPTSTDRPRPSSSTACGTADIPSQRSAVCASTTRAASGSSCIAQSGLRRMARFRRSITSIIAMVTRRTTTSRTSPSGLVENTSASTHRSPIASLNRGRTSTEPSRRPQSGTGRPRASSGIAFTVLRSWLLVRSWVCSAWSAMMASSPRTIAPRSAACGATPSVGGTAGSTTSTWCVRDASERSSGTGTSVPDTAPMRVRHVQPTMRVEQTYELSIEGVHEFFANGIVVANCADAGLYGHRHSYQFRWRPADVPPPKGSVERLQREAKELEDELLS